MELTDLRVFIEVAELGSITAAANKIHRVPSGVTTRIQHLEDEIGINLFERIGKKMIISSDGQVFLDYAKRIVCLADESVEVIGNFADRGKLRIGTMDSVAFRFLKDFSKYHSRYPDVKLSLISGTASELIAKVKNGDLDIAIVLDPSKEADLTSELIIEDEVCLISDLQHPVIKNQESIGTSSILAFRLGCPYRYKLEEWLKSANVVPSRIVEIHSYHAMIGCVVAGMGIAVVPKSILSGYPKKSGVKIHEFTKKISQGELRAIYRGTKPNQKCVKLLDILKKV